MASTADRKRQKFWFRDLDSNQDTQLQRLMSYQLDDPGILLTFLSLSESFPFAQGRSRCDFSGNFGLVTTAVLCRFLLN